MIAFKNFELKRSHYLCDNKAVDLDRHELSLLYGDNVGADYCATFKVFDNVLLFCRFCHQVVLITMNVVAYFDQFVK